MKQQEVFKKIGGILKELNEQYEYLQGAEEPLNDLELELFLANSHFLADHLLILSKLNSQIKSAGKPAAKTELPHERKYFEPLVQPFTNTVKNVPDISADEDQTIENHFELSAARDNSIPPIDLESSAHDSYSFTSEEPETIRHELILDESDWEDEDEPYENPDIDLVSDEDRIEIPPLPEKHVFIAAKEEEKLVKEVALPAPEPVKPEPFKEDRKAEPMTINERMSAQMAEKSGVAITVQPISDLKPAITLNDKLLFIKDLFNGYSLAYSEAIEILNRFNTFDEADLFLKKNYVVKNNWESKPETTAKLYELLKRRYA
jgi:hypothetical protein